MEIIASVLVFLGMASFTAFFYIFGKMRRSREIVSKIKETHLEIDGTKAGSGRFTGKFLELAVSLGRVLKPKNQKEVSKMRNSLIRGGFRKDPSLAVFYGIKVITGAVLGAVFFFLKIFLFITVPVHYFFFFLITFFALGFYFPDILLKLRINSRKRQISEYFPDALDLMVVCVEAGMGLDAAINRVGEELKFSNKVLSEEFRLLSLELRAGKPRKDALKSLATRVDLEDVNSLVTLLIQTDRFGTKVAQALRVYSDSMRTKRHQKAEEIASKLPIKLVFPLVLFIFPSLFITILGPALIQLYRNTN